jgi:dihydrofolate reductase
MANIELIAAAAGSAQVIGLNGAMPWHLPTDLKHFKQVTLGHPVLMGRTTYDSVLQQLGKPLPGRRNLVMTHQRDWRDDRAECFHDLASALAAVGDGETLFVIGGQQLYEQTLPLAQTVHLTRIEANIEGDRFFPPLPSDQWRLVWQQTQMDQGLTLTFCRYGRIPTPQQD